MTYQIEIFPKLGSTNEYLKELACSGAPEGTVIIAREQTAGKGRWGRSWTSSWGGAWFSILLRPPIPVEQASCIAMLIAVSLAQALRERWGLGVGVKWPNDLYVPHPHSLPLDGAGVKYHKLGGILLELSSRAHTIEWLIAGIGVNVNNELPKETRIPATSLARELGKPVSLAEFFEIALWAMAQSYERFLSEGFDFVRTYWQELSVLPKRIAILTDTKNKIEAEVLGLGRSGKLVVRTPEGVRELASEDVMLCQL